jgi:hypothetical protein
MEREPTFPFWGQLSMSTATPAVGNRMAIKWGDSALGSSGRIEGTEILYRAMWRPILHTTELAAIFPASERIVFSAGRISMVSQFDPELELSSASSVALAPAAIGAETPFSPTGLATALRVVASTGSAMPYGDGWKLAATVPFSNEHGDNGGAGRLDDLSDDPKGLFVEAYLRQGLDSYGVNAYFGRDGRNYQGLVLQRTLGSFRLEGGAGQALTVDGTTTAYSLGIDWAPQPDRAAGLRVDRQADTTVFVPFVSYLLDFDGTALRLFVESRLQDGARPTTSIALKFRF